MPKTRGLSGPAVGLAAAGGLLIYAGVTHQTVPDALRGLVKGSATGPAPFVKPSTASASGVMTPDITGGTAVGQTIASNARKYLGIKYVYGGKTPNGFDCSGLVQWIFIHDMGIADCPRTATQQLFWSKLQRISRSDVAAGDLTYWGGIPAHIGIAISNTQGIYAPHTGTVVQIQSIDRTRAGLVCLRYVGPSTSKIGKQPA
jgi:cell wall-associated NlpC family hydrolase